MKIISLLLVTILCVCLCGCKKTPEKTSSLPTAVSTVSSVTNSSESQVVSTSSVESEVSSVASVVSKPEKPSLSSTNSTNSEKPKVCTHNFTVSTVDAKCAQDGLTTKTCTLCGHTEKAVIKATGHKMVSGKCTDCGYADITECRNSVSNWLKKYPNSEYRLDDSRYYFTSSGGGNIFFHFEDGNTENIIISIYGWEKNLCYINYIKDVNVEGEFPMDSVHSTNRIYFNQMNGTATGNQKTQMVTELRNKIDGVLLKFQEVMQSNIGVTLKDIGFTAY